MKIYTKESSDFKPFSITFDFHTQQEADDFYSLFNTKQIADALRNQTGISPKEVRDCIQQGGREEHYMYESLTLCLN